MSNLKASHVAQKPLVAEFEFNFNDTMDDVNGVNKDFGATMAVLTVHSFDIIKLPVNSVITGGSVVVKTAFDTAGYDVVVGDSASANRYLASADLKAAGITALVPTGYVNAGLPLRIGVSTDDACTTGKMLVRIEYVIEGRADEVSAKP